MVLVLALIVVSSFGTRRKAGKWFILAQTIRF